LGKRSSIAIDGRKDGGLDGKMADAIEMRPIQSGINQCTSSPDYSWRCVASPDSMETLLRRRSAPQNAVRSAEHHHATCAPELGERRDFIWFDALQSNQHYDVVHFPNE